MKLVEEKVKDFLGDLAAKKPAPGGGSASALAGAMAAALVQMVARFTIGKEKYKKVEEKFQQLEAEAEKLKSQLSVLVDKDTEAYLKVVKTKGSQKAILRAAQVPLETARVSLKVLKMASYAAKYGNQNLRSDAFCAIELATAAIYGALENVRINLPLIKDGESLTKIRDSMEKLLASGNLLVKQ